MRFSQLTLAKKLFVAFSCCALMTLLVAGSDFSVWRALGSS